MPAPTNLQITARQVTQNDELNGQTVTTIKTGTKWAEFRNESGKLIARLELDDCVTVTRMVKTQDEIAAEKKQAEDKLIERCVEMLTDKLNDGLENTPTKFMQARIDLAAERGNDNRLIDHWDIDRLMTLQAEYNIFFEISQKMKRWDANDDMPNNMPEKLFVAGYSQIVAAYAVVLQSELRRASIVNPLSRSTSVTSNIEEDLKIYVAREMLRGFNAMQVQELVARIDADEFI